ncbi:MAG TPA: hypothetical protein VHA52_00185 [Candidatus Babeliaceae bacterium]|nr:hypothetical protein [Candidatus Babeliaceae bacterium]
MKTFSLIRYSILTLGLFFIAGCLKQEPIKKEKAFTLAETKKAITVFVHGTLPPLVRGLVHTLDCPQGLMLAKDFGTGYLMGRIPFLLSEADPLQFPLNKFYLFGWSGALCFKERKAAALALYQALKKLDGALTIIAHSHGGNVALYLAEIAQELGDTNFYIDCLILLGVPVQQATKNLIASPIFKKIYAFYSCGDWTQCADPQGIYSIGNSKDQSGPLFSERIFPTQKHLKHVRVFYKKYNLDHIGFILRPFIKALPKLLKLVQTAPNDCSVNISPKKDPELYSR